MAIRKRVQESHIDADLMSVNSSHSMSSIAKPPTRTVVSSTATSMVVDENENVDARSSSSSIIAKKDNSIYPIVRRNGRVYTPNHDRDNKSHLHTLSPIPVLHSPVDCLIEEGGGREAQSNAATESPPLLISATRPGKRSKKRRRILTRKPKKSTRSRLLPSPNELEVRSRYQEQHRNDGSNQSGGQSTTMGRDVKQSLNICLNEPDFDFLRKILPHVEECAKHRLEKRHCPRRCKHRRSEIDDWTIDDVVEFVRRTPSTSSSSLAERFRDEQIDGEALLLLTRKDLVQHMRIKLGSALKIFYSIKCLSPETSTL